MQNEHDDEADTLEQLAHDRDVAGLTRHSRKLLGEVKKWRDKAREHDGSAKQKDMTPYEKFWADAQNRLLGLEGDTRKAELDKISAEVEALVGTEIQRRKQSSEETLKTLNDDYARIRTESEIAAIASRLAKQGTADLLNPLLRERIAVTRRDDGEWNVTYRDAAGQPVAIEALEFEFRNNKALAPIIEGTSAEDKAAHAKRVAETLGLAGGKVH